MEDIGAAGGKSGQAMMILDDDGGQDPTKGSFNS